MFLQRSAGSISRPVFRPLFLAVLVTLLEGQALVSSRPSDCKWLEIKEKEKIVKLLFCQVRLLE